jgi:hypothetical protein
VEPLEIITSILPKILQGGGPEVVITLLLGIIAFFWIERKRLLKLVEKNEDNLTLRDNRISKILDDYNEGNKTLTEAFTQLRIVLAEIKGKM